MDENSEEGVILGAIFNDKTIPNGSGVGIFRVKFEDDSVIEYNRNSHEYNLDIKGKINISAQSEININAVTANVNASALAKIESPVIQLKGAVAITGAMTITGGISAPSGAPISGDFKVSGDVKAGTVSLKTHVHSGVTTGGGSSGPPTP
jgi:phage baseplate assembly protein V